MHELNKNQEYIIVCRSGEKCKSCSILESYGFQVINVVGGMLAWEGKVE